MLYDVLTVYIDGVEYYEFIIPDDGKSRDVVVDFGYFADNGICGETLSVNEFKPMDCNPILKKLS